MSIFRDMFEQRQFDTDRDYREVKRMLGEAIAGGYVEQIPVAKPDPSMPDEKWFREKETGEVFSLAGPGEKTRGNWDRVDLGEDSLPDSNRRG